MSNPIFRKKSIEKVTSPEQINDYIRVSNPSVWMILAAVIVLLAGVCVWGVFGRLDTAVQTGGSCTNGQLVVYISEKDYGKISEKTILSVDGAEYNVSEISDTPIQLGDDTDPYLIYLTGLSKGDWVYILKADVSGVRDGAYAVSVITERVRPLDFVLN